MEITLQNALPVIVTEKKSIQLWDTLVIDWLEITLPGEYEKSGVLLNSKMVNGHLLHDLHIERKSVGFIPASIIECTEELMAFYGDLDILFIEWKKEDIKIFESLEARIVVPYGEQKDIFLLGVWQAELEGVDKFKTKESDFEGETTLFVKLN
jgi:hypothetical protein